MDALKPLVSIILPVRNAEKFIKDCLRSLVSQTYKNIEIVAIDDNSTDKTRKILRSFRRHYKRIRIVQNKKQYGVAISLNRAVKRAKGSFLAFMDAKDKSHKERIKKQASFLLANPKVVVVGTQGILIDRKNKTHGKFLFPKDHDNICQTLVSGFSLQSETAMINTLLLPKDILRFKNYTYPLLFSEMFVKLLPYGLLANLKNYLYYRRVEKNSRFEKIKQYPSLIKLFFKSITIYDYRPSFWSIFLPLFRVTH